MANLQVKNFPDDLHAELGARARAEHSTMSEYVTRVLRRDLRRPRFAEWAERVRRENPVLREFDTSEAIAEARAEYDADERFDQ
ncbi:FitA-like ribbon-helix-helix domain-containing protein [Gordonia iterans]